MKLIAPDYYTHFQCIADRCRHSCCIGWEIDIDDDTLARYHNVPGSFGERLRAGINANGETACFRLSEDERCPFLNERGLCDIILTLGEDALSQICADHPRFRNFLSDRTEIGLGLCCEAAGRLILSRTEPVRLVVQDDDGLDDGLTPFEEYLLDVRDELFAIAQNPVLSIDARMDALLSTANTSLPDMDAAQWAQLYLELEMLDPQWGKLLHLLDTSPESSTEIPEAALEQLLVYFLYRHISAALDEFDLRLRVAFCVHAVQFIRSLCTQMMFSSTLSTMDNLVECARMYSSEIEYSDENIDRLLDAIAGA